MENGQVRINGGLLPAFCQYLLLKLWITKKILYTVLFPESSCCLENAFGTEYQKLEEHNESLHELRKECTAKR